MTKNKNLVLHCAQSVFWSQTGMEYQAEPGISKQAANGKDLGSVSWFWRLPGNMFLNMDVQGTVDTRVWKDIITYADVLLQLHNGAKTADLL